MSWGLADAVAEAMEEEEAVRGPYWYTIYASFGEPTGIVHRRIEKGAAIAITSNVTLKYARARVNKLNKLFLEGNDPYLKQEDKE